MRLHRLATWTLALSLLGASAWAADWPNWRGPSYNGATEAKDLPVRFSRTEGVKWSTPLPGPSAATPIVWGDSIFLSSTDPKAQALLAMALDRKTGEVRWRHAVGSGYRPAGMGEAIRMDNRSDYASPSPTTDGKHVVFFYGNGDTVAFDFAGRKLWSRNLQQEYGDFCFGWTFSSSPLLYDGRLYMQVLQGDMPVAGRGKEGSPSFLLALDPATGRELWKALRPSPAKNESREAFSSPVPYEHNGRKEILLAGSDFLTSHDPATGKELWRWGTWNLNHLHPTLRMVPSPVAGAGMVLACGPKREPVFAVKAGGAGTLGEGGMAWKSDGRGAVTSDVPTPLFYRGRFYVLSDIRKTISCVEPADGKIVWSTPLPGPSMCWGSPTGADGKIYFQSLRGEVHVVDADKGDLLATNPMAEEENELRSTIAVAGDNLFVRTNSRLYCIGK